jgi:hypothetical protein
MEDLEQNKEQGHQIYVFSMNGDLLYKSGRIENVHVGWAAGYISSLNMCWLDDEIILYNTYPKPDSVSDMSVHAINIDTGKENILFNKALQNTSLTRPYYFSVLKLDDESQNPGQYLYLAADDGHKQYVAKGESIGGIYILAGTKTAYNAYNYKSEGENDDAVGLDGVMVYDMKTKGEKFIKDANIIGVSKDGTKVFYMTNNRLLLPIP